MVSLDLTRRALSLGTRDTVTGWCKKVWTETTIQGWIIEKSSQLQALKAGTWVRTDALLLTEDGIVEGDQVKTQGSVYYEVKAVRPMMNGDSLDHYECDLHREVVAYDVDYSTYAGTFLRDDARYRNKVYIQTYWVAANAEDDAGNALTVQCMYGHVPYPLTLELYNGSTNDVLILLGKAKTTPLIGHDHAAYGYSEQVPVTIAAIDKTGITADKAVTQCEIELRRIMETYPSGSVRTLDQTNESTEILGSNTLYQIDYLMNYTRDKT